MNFGVYIPFEISILFKLYRIYCHFTWKLTRTVVVDYSSTYWLDWKQTAQHTHDSLAPPKFAVHSSGERAFHLPRRPAVVDVQHAFLHCPSMDYDEVCYGIHVACNWNKTGKYYAVSETWRILEAQHTNIFCTYEQTSFYKDLVKFFP
jgi:hypothetical protein